MLTALASSLLGVGSPSSLSGHWGGPGQGIAALSWLSPLQTPGVAGWSIFPCPATRKGPKLFWLPPSRCCLVGQDRGWSGSSPSDLWRWTGLKLAQLPPAAGGGEVMLGGTEVGQAFSLCWWVGGAQLLALSLWQGGGKGCSSVPPPLARGKAMQFPCAPLLFRDSARVLHAPLLPPKALWLPHPSPKSQRGHAASTRSHFPPPKPP